MTIRLPSLRSLIAIVVLLLLVGSVMFIRSFFISSFQKYQTSLNQLDLENRISTLYHDLREQPDQLGSERVKEEVQVILEDMKQVELSGLYLEQEMVLYSTFIFIFLMLAVLVIFLGAFTFITRPLNRLVDATRELASGNFEVTVHESPISNMNRLIIAFNQMTTELLSNREKLLQAEKDMMWRDMARVMAHEIKNPLTPIRLATERLERKHALADPDFPKVFKETAQVIHEEVNSLQSLVNAFSEFARMPPPEPAKVALAPLIREICAPWQDQVEFSLHLPDDELACFADRMQLRQVLTNLIQNGIQAQPVKPRMDISAQIEDEECLVTISDHGPGIPDADLPRIFQPYFTTKEKGTGLGLTIVQRIIQMHNGKIEVNSQPGIGTSFNLTLPRS